MCKMNNKKKNFQLVKVYVRLRPFTQNEIKPRRPSTVHEMTAKEICVKSGSVQKKYSFDGVFGMNFLQSEVYEVVVYPMINYVLSGYTCTVFAYGQTGTGKTYTMLGQNIAPNFDFSTDPSVGIIPRAAFHLFSELDKLKAVYTVRVTIVEIYNEEVRDLLIRDSAPLRVYDEPDNKGATYIKNITEMAVANTDEVYELLNAAERHTAATNLNRHSSRSHTIFTIIVKIREHIDGEQITKTGKLHLIDLAGSENIGRSGATKVRAREAWTINKSLLTLGNVIKALALKMTHIPYRESKLTRILQDSLGGKSRTCMIATFSPSIDAFDETVGTLDYAHMARRIANTPTVNINRQQTNIFKTSQDELHPARAREGFYMHSGSYERMNAVIKTKNQRILRLEDHNKMKQQHFDELKRAIEGTNLDVQLSEDELEHVMKEVNGNLCELFTKHECNCTSANCNLTFDSIFRNKTWSKDTVLSQFQNVSNCIIEHSAAIEARAAQYSALIDQAFLEEEEHATLTNRTKENLVDIQFFLDNFSECLRPISDLVSLEIENCKNNTGNCQRAIKEDDMKKKKLRRSFSSGHLN